MTDAERRFDFSIQWASCPKWATVRESEAVATVESIDGNVHVVLVDVQGSGSNGGRRLALGLIGFCRELLATGVDGESVVNAANQYLLALREGRVAASIHCLTVGSETATVRVSGHGMLFMADQTSGRIEFSSLSGDLAGHRSCGPVVTSRFDLNESRAVAFANDGIGDLAKLPALSGSELPGPAQILDASNDVDGGRPKSDKSVVVIGRTQIAGLDRRTTGSVGFPKLGRGR